MLNALTFLDQIKRQTTRQPQAQNPLLQIQNMNTSGFGAYFGGQPTGQQGSVFSPQQPVNNAQPTVGLPQMKPQAQPLGQPQPLGQAPQDNQNLRSIFGPPPQSAGGSKYIMGPDGSYIKNPGFVGSGGARTMDFQPGGVASDGTPIDRRDLPPGTAPTSNNWAPVGGLGG